LSNIRHIINVASSRGAFKTEEFSVIGAVYERLDAFVSAVEAKNRPVDEVDEVDKAVEADNTTIDEVDDMAVAENESSGD